MRTIFENVAVNIGQTATTSELRPGARNEGWRLWDGILRVVADAGDVTVLIRSTVTGETIETVALVGGANKSSNTFKIPGAYDVQVSAVATANAVVSVYLDGVSGIPPAQVTVA